jgi:hypothetical protein
MDSLASSLLQLTNWQGAAGTVGGHLAPAGLQAAGPSVAGAFIRPLVWLVLALGHGASAGQDLYYVEPGAASCPRLPEPQAARPMTVAMGAPVHGRLHVGCGFADGSYTVTLSATDPGAMFAPRTFLVNFGQVVGSGAYVVTFATIGIHSVTASVTSNMGSPPVQGQFVGPDSAFNVVRR